MPSPIAHISAGYLLFAVFRRFLSEKILRYTGKSLFLLGLCLSFSLLPDIDSALGFVARDLGRYHNQWTHSLLTGLGVCLVFTLMMRLWRQAGFATWLGISYACYALHVIMDFFTYGRGVMLFWPLTDARYKFEPPLFRGLRWSEGLISVEHIWTALQEIAFALVLLGAYIALRAIGTACQPARNRLDEPD